mmetsp:Transcript_28590/g.69272  ORF Transcript_28590/g.69272 Transcript_28590/m.69272 type:complete len:418 (-) Transcript_28590:218-1471(-)
MLKRKAVIFTAILCFTTTSFRLLISSRSEQGLPADDSLGGAVATEGITKRLQQMESKLIQQASEITHLRGEMKQLNEENVKGLLREKSEQGVWNMLTATNFASSDIINQTITENDKSGEPLTFHIIYNGAYSKFGGDQLRSIESIYYHHPNAHVIFHTGISDEPFSIPSLDPLRKKFDLEFNFYNLTEELHKLRVALNNSPTWDQDDDFVAQFINRLPNWVTPGKSLYPLPNKANIMRAILMYMRGGIYMDTDVFVLRPLDGLGENVLGKESQKSVNNAIMKFQKGHKYLEKAIYEIIKHFNPNKWGQQGPKALSRTLKKHYPNCSFVGDDKKGVNCPIDVLEVNAFYPFRWFNTGKMCKLNFTGTSKTEWRETIEKRSFFAHLTWPNKSMPTIPGTICHWIRNNFCVTNETCAIPA